MSTASNIARKFSEQAAPLLEDLYGSSQTAVLLDEIVSMLQHHRAQGKPVRQERWDERDVILIAYGDSLNVPGERPLQTLRRFVADNLKGKISTVHILPFFPYSSDDGFSVIDYKTVNPELGSWDDISRLTEEVDLMIDLVINHVSRESLWFIDFINNKPPACYYFIEMHPQVDLSEVVRPRKSKVLTPVHTHRGVKHVWSTFSEDQIDLNFTNPNVLLEFVRIILLYLQQGARFIRLDAIAYLWKKLGTSCINLPQTHDVVKLLRLILDAVAPDAILLTETNLPHDQNLSYFGQQDEAHMVYQFSLAPLLLHGLHRGTSHYLSAWARGRCEAPQGCTFLNFTASHDGIGLRPAEGLLPEKDIHSLVEAMHGFGGFVSMKSNPDGTDSPYEINISLFEALKGTMNGTDQWQIPRFICSQTIMLALKGIPALYIHSLLATPNDLAGVETTGRTRSINRRRWDLNALNELLENPYTPNALVFAETRRLLGIRNRQKAFHPDASQTVLTLGDEFFAVLRQAVGQQTIIAISNVTDWPQHLDTQQLPGYSTDTALFDLLSGKTLSTKEGFLILSPYQSLWLTTDPQDPQDR